MRLLPQFIGNLQRIDLAISSLSDLITGLMQLPMMGAAGRDGELIAHFHADRPWLGKAQVMRIGRLKSPVLKEINMNINYEEAYQLAKRLRQSVKRQTKQKDRGREGGANTEINDGRVDDLPNLDVVEKRMKRD